MKYLVNVKNKNHVIMPTDTSYVPEGYRCVKADSDGWIPFNGTVCPLPDNCHTQIRFMSGTQSEPQPAINWAWFDESIADYRPILEKAQEPEPTAFERQRAEIHKRRLRIEEQEYADNMQKPEPIPAKLTTNTLDLLGTLKRAHEHAQTIPDLEAELREVLGSMGYDLVARSPFVEPEPAVETPQDMSDWRNWREGDRIEFVKNFKRNSDKCYAIGMTHEFGTDDFCDTGIKDKHGQVWAEGNIASEYFQPECFRFHSRPAKGEK